jgi:oxygen-dependent protoporphyrinogen oxidase
VVVIGGGAAGLIAACRLRMRGAEPTVFEAGAEPGGMLLTRREGDWLAELGADSVAETGADAWAVLEACGAGGCRVRPAPEARRRYVVCQGVPVPLPMTVADLVASPLLSLGGRLRLAREPFIAPLRDAAIEESVEQFTHRRFGEEAAAWLFDPLIAGTSGGDPARLLARHAFPKLVEYERTTGSVLKGQMRAGMEARRRARGEPRGLWSCREGLGALVARMTERLGDAVRRAEAVLEVSPRGDGVDIRTAAGRSTFDAALLALPARVTAAVLESACGAERMAPLATMPHGSIAVVALGFRREEVDHPLDGSGLLVPSHERRAVLSVHFTSSMFPDRAPAGHVLLTATLGGVQHPEATDRDDAQLVALVRRELGSLLGVRGEPVFAASRVWRDAVPQAVFGHSARLARAEDLEREFPRLAFTGAWHDGLAVSEVFDGGVRAADRLWDRC